MVAGRKAKPAEERVRRGDNASPMPIIVGGREIPPKPPFLTPNMSEAWDYLVNDLAGADMLDHADGAILEAAAVLWGTARDARFRRLAEVAASEGAMDGLTERSPQGRIENKLLVIERNTWREFRNLADNLPLSPWGRARLGLKGKVRGASIEDDIGPPPRMRIVQ